MLDRLRTWLDAREDARRRRESQQGSNSVGGDARTAAAAPTPSRREGLRPRAVAGGTKPSATAAASASEDPYVLVTVGTTKFEALIRCVSFSFCSSSSESLFFAILDSRSPIERHGCVRTINHTRARAVDGHKPPCRHKGTDARNRRRRDANSAPADDAPTKPKPNHKKNRAIDTPEFGDALTERGYTRLIVQKGAGNYAPTRLLAGGRGAAASSSAGRLLRVELS